MQVLAIGECMIEMSGGQHGNWRLGFAGDTLNTLWYTRAVLDPAEGPVGYFTALGDDPFSNRIVDFMRANGIDTHLIRRLEGRRPGLYLIEQIAGDRHFTYWRETSAARRLADDEGALRGAMDAARMIYFSGISLAILSPEARARLLALAGEARRAGTPVAFDPNVRPALWESEAVMRQTLTTAAEASSIVLPSFDDERKVFGDASTRDTVARYLDAGADEVAVKNGAEPVLVGHGDVVRELPARPVKRVVDPTGAGDSFNGAYLGVRLKGASAEEAAEAGIAVAAQVIGAHGAIIETGEMARWRNAVD